MTGERTGGTGGSGGDAGVDERLVEFLRTADRPRHLASDVAAALGLARGRARIRLQALAGENRVIRSRAGTTARWAVPERANEPDPGTDVEGDEPKPGADAEEDGSDTGTAEEQSSAEASEDDDVADAGATAAPQATDTPTTAEGPTGGTADRSTGAARSASAPGPSGDGDGLWRPGPAHLLALAVGTVLAIAAIRLLWRR